MTTIKTNAQSKKTVAGSAKTALVVDDSKLARYVLKEMLVKHGISVTTASSAEEALGLLCTLQPDVIFMDHMMPGMDGFQALHAIKSDPKTATIPTLMYTSREQSCDKDVYFSQARALGAVGVLPKKLKPMELEKVLAQLKLLPGAESVEASEPPVVQSSVTEFDVTEPTAIQSDLNAPLSETEVIQPETSEPFVQTELERSQQKAEVEYLREDAQRDIEFDQEAVRIINDSKYSLEELAKSAEEEYEKDSMRVLFRQLFNEQKEEITHSQQEAMKSLVEQTSPWFFSSHKRFLRWQKLSFLTVIAVILLVSSIFFDDNEMEMQAVLTLQQQLNEQQELIQKLSDQLDSLQQFTRHIDDSALNNSTTSDSESGQFRADSVQFESAGIVSSEVSSLSVIDSSLPANSSYKQEFDPLRLPYGVSFDDERLQASLVSMLHQLSEDDFTGVLQIRLHTGRFCEAQGLDGLLVKAADELPLSECQVSVLSAMEYANRVSLDLESFMASIKQQFPEPRVEFEDAGRHSILVAYPERNSELTAKEWNRVASVNNRLEFTLLMP